MIDEFEHEDSETVEVVEVRFDWWERKREKKMIISMVIKTTHQLDLQLCWIGQSKAGLSAFVH